MNEFSYLNFLCGNYLLSKEVVYIIEIYKHKGLFFYIRESP